MIPIRTLRTTLILGLLTGLILLAVVGCGSSDQVRIDTSQTRTTYQILDTPLRIHFTDDVVSQDMVGLVLDSTVVTFDPPVYARYRWVDQRTLEVRPTAPLKPATDYQVSVRDVEVANDRQLGGGPVTLTMPLLYLEHHRANVQLAPDDPDKLVLVTQLNFNLPVEASELREHVTLTLAGEPLAFTLHDERARDSNILTSEPFDRPTEETEATVRLDGNLTPRDGERPMGKSQDITVQVKEPGALKVNRISVGAERAGADFLIDVRFSDPIPADLARDFIRLEPEKDISIITRGSSLQIGGDFQQMERVKVTVLAGIRSISGQTLQDDFSQTLTFPMQRPSLEMMDDGHYLSRTGLHNLALEVVNIDSVRVEIARIHANNLVPFLHDGGLRPYGLSWFKYGAVVVDDDLPIIAPEGEDLPLPTPVTVNLDGALDEHPSGLFSVTVRNSERYWQNATRTVLLTDIGLVVKRGEETVHAWAIDTQTLDPLQGVTLSLLSRANQTLSTGVSDGWGHAVLPLSDDDRDDMQPFVVTAVDGDQFSFLALEDGTISLGDWPVDGRRLPADGYQAFVYGPRDAYRPGETVELAAVIRPVRGEMPAEFPVRLELRDPRGNLIAERRTRTLRGGIAEFSVALPASARTGRYRAAVFSSGDEADGSVEFLVEEFMPDRIKVALRLDREELAPGEELALDVTGTMLYGPPAAGRTVTGKVTLQPAPFEPEGWADWRFGDDHRADRFRDEHAGRQGDWSSLTTDLGEKELDADGHASFRYTLPDEGLRPPAALQGMASVSVLETGGRAVTNRRGFTAHAYPHYLGLQPAGGKRPAPGQEARFRAVAVTPHGDGTTVQKVTAKLVHYTWQNALRNGRGGYGYRAEQVEELVAERTVTLSVEPVEVAFTPPTYGRFAVVLEDSTTGARTAYSFYASGWGSGSWALDSPDRLELVLDKERYRAGEMAQVTVLAPFPGTLVLTVERDEVLHHELHRLNGNTAMIELPVLAEYSPNVYVTGVLVRGTGDVDPEAPTRAFGTVPLHLDLSPQTLDLALDTPAQIEPETTLPVTVRVPNADGPTALTIAAVDEGILQLTGFVTPDPLAYFYGTRALGVSTAEMFADLLPDVEAAMLHSTPGGGKALDLGHLSSLSQHRVQPVALWSGVVEVADSRATVELDVPEFTGRLRVMALAASGDRFGSTDTDVIVRAPLLVQPSLPRFAAGGDRFEVPVTVTNSTGRGGQVTMELTVDGPLEITGNSRQSLRLAADEEGVVRFSLAALPANEVATVTVAASANGERAQTVIQLPVRPPSQPLSRTGTLAVAAGKSASITLPDEFYDGTARVAITAMSTPALRFAGPLEWLLRYPYGCLEQTVSRAFPLLRFDDVAARIQPGQFEQNAPEYFVEEAIQKVIALQFDDDGFYFWPDSDTRVRNAWAGVYAAHFLAEARALEYPVPDEVMGDVLRFLRRAAGGDFDEKSPRSASPSLQDHIDAHNRRVRAYAMYVLAGMDEPERGAMNRMYAVHAGELPTDTRALLAGAFARAGDWTTANDLLPATSFPALDEPDEEVRSFHSALRADAIVLTILAEQQPEHALVPVLLKRIAERVEGRSLRYTTQDIGWVMLALGQLYSRTETPDYTLTIAKDGEVLASGDEAPLSLLDPALAGETVDVTVEGSGTAYVYWEARGLPLTPSVEIASEGIQVRRELYDDSGSPLDLTALRQGEVIVAKLVISSTDGREHKHVVIDDLLPAGLEVENSRLESREQIPWLGRGGRFPVAMLDVRDDRVLVFGDVPPSGEHQVVYALRAVTVGEFTLPGVRAEGMYDPGVHAQGPASTVTVVRR